MATIHILRIVDQNVRFIIEGSQDRDLEGYGKVYFKGKTIGL